MEYDYDLAVVGAGPGGYVAAIRAAQLGLKACVIEKDKPGGVCLNLGCIPSKALIGLAGAVLDASTLRSLGAAVDLSGLDYGKAFRKSRQAAERLSRGVDFLLRKNGVDLLKGYARLIGESTLSVDGDKLVRARAIILATGSRPRELPGMAFDETAILSSSGALMLERLPPRVAILGAGPIGMEMAYVWNAFGADVTVIEAMGRILPLEDEAAAAVVRKAYEARGVRFMTGTRAGGMERIPSGLRLALAGAPAPDGTPQERESGSLETDAVLVAVGRVPNSEGLGLEEMGVRTERGYVAVGPWYESSLAGVYAIGDLVATPQLAHVASKEGEIAAERIAHLIKGSPLPAERTVDSERVPSAVYGEPELAAFGLQEGRARETGTPFSSYSFPFRGIGKAVAAEKPEGFVKIVASPDGAQILGATVVGHGATDLIHEIMLASRSELCAEDLADMIHAHPTLSEGVMEAARGILGRAVHA